VSISFGWGKGGKVTVAEWLVRQYDLIWHVMSRSSVVISITNCYIRVHFTLLYKFYSFRHIHIPIEKCLLCCHFGSAAVT